MLCVAVHLVLISVCLCTHLLIDIHITFSLGKYELICYTNLGTNFCVDVYFEFSQVTKITYSKVNTLIQSSRLYHYFIIFVLSVTHLPIELFIFCVHFNKLETTVISLTSISLEFSLTRVQYLFTVFSFHLKFTHNEMHKSKDIA